jgi:hypothetical protein
MKDEVPYNEAWWERELHRNEKLMDRYLAALADNPELAQLREADDGPEARMVDPDDLAESAIPASANALEADQLDELLLESEAAIEEAEVRLEEIENGLENSPPNNENYLELAKSARRFAVAIARLEPCSEVPEILFLSAPKVGANLAGGHGLGYDEETLCGNIVKCRWALADCEFCREMLEQLVQRTGREVYRTLAAQSVRLSEHIRERIARLRVRVWW